MITNDLIKGLYNCCALSAPFDHRNQRPPVINHSVPQRDHASRCKKVASAESETGGGCPRRPFHRRTGTDKNFDCCQGDHARRDYSDLTDTVVSCLAMTITCPAPARRPFCPAQVCGLPSSETRNPLHFSQTLVLTKVLTIICPASRPIFTATPVTT